MSEKLNKILFLLNHNSNFLQQYCKLDEASRMVSINSANTLAIIHEKRKKNLEYMKQCAQLLEQVQVQVQELTENRVWRMHHSSTFWEIYCQKNGNVFFKENFRMNRTSFNKLCTLLDSMEKKDANFCNAIPLEKRVAVAIYALGSSSEYRSIGDLFGISNSTVCALLLDFCKKIYILCKNYLPTLPFSRQDIVESVQGFLKMGFPQCLGALDCCHIEVHPSKDEAQDYYNKKGWHSVVLLALIDHKCRFLYINIGSPGKCNDSYIFENSKLKRSLEQSDLLEELSVEYDTAKVPVVLIGDSSFPVRKYLMTPYPDSSNTTTEQNTFNYKLSKCHRVAENAFGHVKARFRSIGKGIDNKIENVNIIIAAACTLHNFLIAEKDEIEDIWINEKNTSNGRIQPHASTNVRHDRGLQIRDDITKYLTDNNDYLDEFIEQELTKSCTDKENVMEYEEHVVLKEELDEIDIDIEKETLTELRYLNETDTQNTSEADEEECEVKEIEYEQAMKIKNKLSLPKSPVNDAATINSRKTRLNDLVATAKLADADNTPKNAMEYEEHVELKEVLNEIYIDIDTKNTYDADEEEYEVKETEIEQPMKIKNELSSPKSPANDVPTVNSRKTRLNDLVATGVHVDADNTPKNAMEYEEHVELKEELDEIDIDIEEEILNELEYLSETDTQNTSEADEEECKVKEIEYEQAMKIKNKLSSPKSIVNDVATISSRKTRLNDLVATAVDVDADNTPKNAMEYEEIVELKEELDEIDIEEDIFNELEYLSETDTQNTSEVDEEDCPKSSANVVATVNSGKTPKRFLLFDNLVATVVDVDADNAPIVEFALARSEGDEKLQVECGICPDIMPKLKLAEHLRTHLVPGTNSHYQCIYCDETFKTYTYLACHARRHRGIRPYVCEICKLYFSTKKDMLLHNYRRHMEKKHTCEICGKNFAQNSHLKRHRESTHETKRRFHCEYCPKSYTKNFPLQRHVRKAHNGKRRVQFCTFCGMQYSDPHDMARHRKEMHLNQTHYICHFCNQEFTDIHYFDAHKRSIQCRNNKRRKLEEERVQQEVEVQPILPADGTQAVLQQPMPARYTITLLKK